MRYLLIIFLFLSQLASGQIINASQPYRPMVVASADTLLLDLYPNAAAAYSVARKLRTAYTGSAIRVRKDSIGQPEQDIGYVNNRLDTVALKNFIGNNSGFVTTTYDNSTNGRNATQTTAASQPRIVNAGTIERQGGIPVLFFDGVNDFLSTSTQIFNSGQQSLFSVARTSNEFGGIITAKDGNFDNAYAVGINSSGRIEAFGGGNNNAGNPTTVLTSTNSFSSTVALISVVYTGVGSSVSLFVNGSLDKTGTQVAANNVVSTSDIGRYRVANANYGLMRVPEIIIYHSNQSSNRTAIESNINAYYNIYTP